MRCAAAALSLCFVLVAGCDQSDDYGPYDTSADQPADSAGDTSGDLPADTAVDPPVDTAGDPPVDTIADTPADTPTDPGSDGDLTDIEKFCTTACIDCFGGTTGWNHLPADQCIPECVADFDDCAPGDIPAILTCTGGDGCPEGPTGFAFCVADYLCMLN